MIGKGRDLDAMERIDWVRDLIAARFQEPLVQADVAEAAGMAPAAFCRFFRRQTGRTFTRYVQELRLSEASQLLSHTTLPITIVAAQVGFGNLAHFNRCFKSQEGMTPTQWRQRFSKPAVVADSV
jgi:transcriptional regulator GlxA family with amidase domain